MKRIVNSRAHVVFALRAATAIALPAQTFTTLHSFNGKEGSSPAGTLVQATNGNFYGTARQGGAYANGTVFKMTPDGTVTRLYSFCAPSACTGGEGIFGGLIQATNGDFYGVTELGGAYAYGGTVFKITASGTLTTVYGFCAQGVCTDGQYPNPGLMQAANGELYGTMYDGGANTRGTVFKITPGGTLTTLYSFCSQSGCTDGDQPMAGLVQAANGDFYGTTFEGGAHRTGTIFKITANGTLTTIYSFCSQRGCVDGEHPAAGLVQATDGAFYGTTFYGGAGGGGNGSGTVFKITPGGALTTLYSFCTQSECMDGAGPSGVIQATDGAFYGTTFQGGAYRVGTVFKVTPSGAMTTLHSFCAQSSCPDGKSPQTELTQATNGLLCGVTVGGGAHGGGTAFSVSVGLGSFVKTLPTSGKVGAVVRILGTDLTGTSSVTFDGTTAAFAVLAPSLITAAVPAGASSGIVQVVTPSGTLSSNVPFRVLP